MFSFNCFYQQLIRGDTLIKYYQFLIEKKGKANKVSPSATSVVTETSVVTATTVFDDRQSKELENLYLL